MGLRTASVRRPHVAVMAPALTESTQNQQTNPTTLFKTYCQLGGTDLDVLSNVCSLERQICIPLCTDIANQTPAKKKKKCCAGASASDKAEPIKMSSPSAADITEEQLLDEVMSSIERNGPADAVFTDDLLNALDITDEMDKESQAKDLLAETTKKHNFIQRRLDFILRRTHKLRAKLLGSHVSSEITGVFEHVHKTLKAEELPNEQSNNDKPLAITQNSLKNLQRKLETASMLQASQVSRHKNTRYFGSGSTEPAAMRNNAAGMVTLPPWTNESKVELDKTTGMMQSQLGIVQKDLDSEATESSSGGESCDEMLIYNNPHQQYLSIRKRALWKYSTERAQIGARWTWLQSQIADLEYRIRQNTDLHKRIRSCKGVVTLGGASPPPSPVLCGLSTPTSQVNGYKGQLPGGGSAPPEDEPLDPAPSSIEYQCARTRPLVNFRKRKLLQVSGLHAVSKKAARPSGIRCSCAPPFVTSCALCTGRTDPTYPRDSMETMGQHEKVACLDSGFHPVFSLPEDTSQAIHYEAIMKTADWQQRTSRLKTVKSLPKASEKNSAPKKNEHRKKYNRLLKPTTISALSAKIKNKYRGRKPNDVTNQSREGRRPKKRHSAKMALAHLQAVSSMLEADEEMDELALMGEDSSPAPERPNSSPILHSQSVARYNKNNRLDSYDIDNIVIPYSVAASTRVEKLQYKEILTPKWRIVEPDFATKYGYYSTSSFNKNNGNVRGQDHEEEGVVEVEDVSEDTVIARHDRCEYEEKKRFFSYLKLPIGYGRSRSQKRTDSRAESSGANTPDPMSPHAMEGADSSDLLGRTSPELELPSISALRRRTISQSRFAKDRDVREDEVNSSNETAVEVAPYDRRAFPLSDLQFDLMRRSMPDCHVVLKTNKRVQDSVDFEDNVDSYLDDKCDSVDSESTESALGDEDPNDPEWYDIESGPKERHKR